jgi:hypothetical protein
MVWPVICCDNPPTGLALEPLDRWPDDGICSGVSLLSLYWPGSAVKYPGLWLAARVDGSFESVPPARCTPDDSTLSSKRPLRCSAPTEACRACATDDIAATSDSVSSVMDESTGSAYDIASEVKDSGDDVM